MQIEGAFFSSFFFFFISLHNGENAKRVYSSAARRESLILIYIRGIMALAARDLHPRFRQISIFYSFFGAPLIIHFYYLRLCRDDVAFVQKIYNIYSYIHYTPMCVCVCFKSEPMTLFSRRTFAALRTHHPLIYPSRRCAVYYTYTSLIFHWTKGPKCQVDLQFIILILKYIPFVRQNYMFAYNLYMCVCV